MKKTLTMFLIVFFSLLPEAVIAQNSNSAKNVLVLHPFLEVGYWTLEFNQGLYEKLNTGNKYETSVYFRYIGMELVPSMKSAEEVLEELKYAETIIKPDVVIAVFQSIHSILIENSSEIFADIPIIYVPVVDPLVSPLEALPNSYVIKSASTYAIKQTLKNIDCIYPDLKYLLVCSGSGNEDLPYLEMFRRIAAENNPDYNIEYLVGPPVDELLSRTASLGPDSAIFLLPINRDNNHVLYSTDNLFPILPRNANAPIFSFSNSTFGQGIVGGNCTSAYSYGEYSGELATNIINDPGFMLSGYKAISKEIYDWRELRRWNIPIKALPEESNIMFRQESFLQKYLYQIVLALLVILLQTFWIVILFMQIKKIRKTDSKLKKSLTEKEILLREVHHRVKNNLAIMSSFLHLQAMDIESNEIKNIFVSSQNRIRSMALVHELLYQDENIKTIDMKDYLNQLVNEIINSYVHDGLVVDVTIEVSDFEISFDILISLGLIITEIVSNSIKYAFSETDNPLLGIKLYQKNEQNILEIYDNGPGLSVWDKNTAQKSGSLGTTIIDALVVQIHGTMGLHTEKGTHYIIAFK